MFLAAPARLNGQPAERISLGPPRASQVTACELLKKAGKEND